MNANNAIVALFFFAIMSGLLLNAADLIGSSVYDLRQIRKQSKLKRKSSYLRRKRPLISVIIPAHNEEAVIERCLESLVKGRYRKYEIIVVDDASRDKTKKIVKEFIKKYPKKNIRVLSKRKNVGRGGAINAGFKKYSSGDLIMAMDADCIVDKNALTNVARHFAIDDISALASNVRIMSHLSIIGILQQFEYISSFRSKKFNTLTNSEYIVGGAGAVYTRDIFKRLKGFNEKMLTEDIALSLGIAGLGNKEFRLVYASDVLVYTEPVPTYFGLFKQRYRWKLGSLQALFANKKLFFINNKRYSRLLSWYRLPIVVWGEVLLLLQPFFVMYFLHLAVNFRRPTLFAISWLSVSFIIAFSLWSDEYLGFWHKLALTPLIPIMYGLLNILTFIQVLAMFRCMFNVKRIFGLTSMKGSWQPPKRIA